MDAKHTLSPQAQRKFRRMALGNAKAGWGHGWAKLSDEQRQTEIQSAVMGIVFCQEHPKYAAAVALIKACLEPAKGEA